MRQVRAVGIVDAPGATPEFDADLGATAPEVGRGIVVEGDAAFGVRRVNGQAEGV